MKRDMLNYKGYLGAMRYDDEEGVFRGRVVNIKDMVTFQGKSVDEVRHEFRESIDDYIEFCASLAQEPDKPFSGRISLRMKPETHKTLNTYAQIQGKSLNGVMAKILDKAARRVNAKYGMSWAQQKPSATVTKGGK
jgi:predicted HicB family RNase H-like nuclease